MEGLDPVGAEEEKVRPWFYSWSLLTKYMPSGSQIHKVSVEGNPNLKAISVSKDGKNIVLYIWYDNEYGYSHQVIRLAKYIAKVRRYMYY